MNKKENIYKPNIGEINNNERVYCSFLEDKLGVRKDDIIDETPSAFIERLVKSGSYMFSKRVIIKTTGQVYDTKIAGKIGDKIITMDNDSIKISDIEKIYEK